MPEVWLPVVGYEDRYEVSDQGRVRRRADATTRYLRRDWRGGDRILKQQVKGRYPKVTLKRGATTERTCIHTIVAAAFHGPRPEGQQVRHANGIRTDNRPENLSYGTSAENIEDNRRLGVLPFGARNGRAIVTEDVVVAIRLRYAAGASTGQLAKETGLTRTGVRHAIRGKTWAHVPGAVAIRPRR